MSGGPFDFDELTAWLTGAEEIRRKQPTAEERAHLLGALAMAEEIDRRCQKRITQNRGAIAAHGVVDQKQETG